MKINNIVLSSLLVILLAGCGSIVKTEPIRVINATSYPELPNIKPLPPINLLAWKHSMPRDMDAVSVKNIKVCRKVKTRLNETKPYVVEPIEEQTDSWWSKCGENPIFPVSNIYVGFDLVNWNVILEDFYKLKERNWQYEQRMIEINNQRKKWRDDAEKERNKGINTPTSTEATTTTQDNKSFLQKIFGQ